MKNLFSQIYILIGSERNKKIQTKRFIQIFKTMLNPEWILYEDSTGEQTQIILKNKNGVIEYIIIGKTEIIEKIEREMTDYAFSEFNTKD